MGGFLLVAVWVVPVVAVAGGLILRKPLQRRLFAGTGLAEWQRTAQQLSWQDRIRLERANSRGHVTTPELAALAVQRGRTMIALVEHAQAKPAMRRAFPAMAALMALLVVANVVVLLSGNTDWHIWVIVLLGTALVVMYAAMPLLQRRQLRKFRRSVELNEALLKPPPPPPGL